MKTRQANKILKTTYRHINPKKATDGFIALPYRNSQIETACRRLKRKNPDFYKMSAVCYVNAILDMLGKQKKNHGISETKHASA